MDMDLTKGKKVTTVDETKLTENPSMIEEVSERHEHSFVQFSPIKVPETRLLNDISSAQIVFVKGEDAATAAHSLDQNKYAFGFTLVDYKLQDISTIEQPINPSQSNRSLKIHDVHPSQLNGFLTMKSVTSIQPIRSMTMPRVTSTQLTMTTEMPSGSPPSFQFMKQNLQMMASTLETSGNSVSPQVRTQLDTKNLMRRVNAKLRHVTP
ncbi:hypothetical protein Fmac_028844 [Flemingia macrophylla]|uniref:Uncharacterized protein n=1 Tax=Flemingia macrophylla TaxID=520843 RepID=A0ABD1L8N2_9FABA